MTPKTPFKRRVIDALVRVAAFCSAATAVFFLGWILCVVVSRGAEALTLDFFLKLPTPPGMTGGGLGNAILGTFVMTALAMLLGVPLGLCAGVYLAEFGRDSWLAQAVRFCANALMGMPSIIIGVFVYSLIVTRIHHFSGFAGAVALALIMLPIVARTAEDMLILVPNALREAALAIGIPRWKAINQIIFKAARSGLLTGVLLAVARVAGETAPLLFTALNSPYWPESLSGPTANLPVTIFNYAMSPYEDWQRTAWGASLLITTGVLGLTLVSRLLLKART